MIRAAKPITWSEHKGVETGAWEISIGEPDRVDEQGRRLHVMDVDILAVHDGLDRALVDAGMEMAMQIPWGTRGPQLMWIDRNPSPTHGTIPITAGVGGASGGYGPGGVGGAVTILAGSAEMPTRAGLEAAARSQATLQGSVPWPTAAVADAFKNEEPPEPTPAQVIQSEERDAVLACMVDKSASWLDLVRHSGLPMKHLSAAVQALKKEGLVVQEGKEYRRA